MWSYNNKYQELYHHGILGMKWGKRNGPPYPLGQGDHSASEKKAGWEKSIKTGKKEKEKRTYSKAEIENHRKKLIDIYKDTDKELSELYKKATDSEIIKDLENREKFKKALVITAAAVGIGAAAYIIYTRHTISAIGNINSALSSGIKPSLESLMTDGLTLDTANNILKVVNVSDDGAKLLNNDQVKAISKAITGGFDIQLSEGNLLARVDYRQNFDPKKASDLVYAAIGETDNKIYQAVLPNRHTNDPFAKAMNYYMKANSGLNIPSLKKSEEILTNLWKNDAKFRRETINAIADMFSKNAGGMPIPKTLVRKQFDLMVQQHGLGYAINTALGGSNKHVTRAVANVFKKNGYNAIFDVHDIIDGVSKLPVIKLDNDLITVGKEVATKDMDLYWSIVNKVMFK